jgi:gas vesicle protein GvpA/GvpJ/GvpM family
MPLKGIVMPAQHSMAHALESTNLADLLERILDKGVVVAGDISIKLVEVELLTIQLRLVICSVDKARELGLDWWSRDARLGAEPAGQNAVLAAMNERLGRLEGALGAAGIAAPPAREQVA